MTVRVTGYSRPGLGEAHAEQHVQARAVFQGSCAVLPLPAWSHFGVKLLLFLCHDSGDGEHSDLDHNTNRTEKQACISPRWSGWRNCAFWRDDVFSRAHPASWWWRAQAIIAKTLINKNGRGHGSGVTFASVIWYARFCWLLRKWCVSVSTPSSQTRQKKIQSRSFPKRILASVLLAPLPHRDDLFMNGRLSEGGVSQSSRCSAWRYLLIGWFL